VKVYTYHQAHAKHHLLTLLILFKGSSLVPQLEHHNSIQFILVNIAARANPSTVEVANRLPPLFDLPLDLMLQVIEMLTVTELRILDRVNRGLRSFITNYLSNTCCKSALFRLPKEVLKKIASHLSPDPGRGDRRHIRNHLARTEQRLDPTLMKHTVVLATENWTSHYLYQAAKHNNLRLATKILRLEGDLEGKDNCRSSYNFCSGTSLALRLVMIKKP
jgi:hypothetical protein